MPQQAPQPVLRQLPTEEARDLLALTREMAQREIAPAAAAEEDAGHFPRETFRVIGRAGLLGLPYSEEYGGGGQPYEVYLQVLEELAAARLTVGLGVSVHTLACHALAGFGSKEQRADHLPGMLGGEQLGAYCLSEPTSGSDAASLRTKAVRDGDTWTLDGTKAWITHGGVADFYTVLARSGGEGARGISAYLVPGDAPGLSAAAPERKMGMKGSPTAQVNFDAVSVPDARRIGEEGQGSAIALSALDSGRLGIAACAIGVAQAALDAALAYVMEHAAVRPADRRLPGAALHARRHGDEDRGGPRALSDGGPAAGRGPALLPAGRDGQALLHRHRDAGDHRRRTACSAATATPRTSPSSATCARRRCCRSSRAPTRSSGWSSPATWWDRSPGTRSRGPAWARAGVCAALGRESVLSFAGVPAWPARAFDGPSRGLRRLSRTSAGLSPGRDGGSGGSTRASGGFTPPRLGSAPAGLSRCGPEPVSGPRLRPPVAVRAPVPAAAAGSRALPRGRTAGYASRARRAA